MRSALCMIVAALMSCNWIERLIASLFEHIPAISATVYTVRSCA
jgi:hypothetical protein